MKKIYLMAVFFLCSCSTIIKYATMEPRPDETIRNPKCENIVALRVFQTLDKFVLADTCEETDSQYCFGHIVYFEKEKDKIYYDEQKIIPSSEQCFAYVGTYKYTTRAESTKVVPKAKLVSARIPNPEYEIWKKEQENKL